MRILVVTSQFPTPGEPTRGRPILQTVRELASLATVQVVSPVAIYPAWARPRSYLFTPPGAGETIDGCDVEYTRYRALPIVSRPLNGWLCAQSIRTVARRFAPDVVLSYWLYPDAFGAMRIARELRVPLVAGARGSDLKVRDVISRRLTQPVVRDAERLLVVSDDLGKVAVERYGADPRRVRTIRNGCDASIFHPRPRRDCRATLGIAPDARLVVYVGRLVPEKGLRELVAAMDLLAANTRDAQLALVGDGPMRAELEELPQVRNGSILLAGAQPAAMVAEWMAAADVVTLPSYSEGHPNVLVEALACGRAVVATPVGGVPEVVDGDCGILVPVRAITPLAQALGDALDRRWDEAALAEKFSRTWQQVAQDTLSACREACASHPSPGGS